MAAACSGKPAVAEPPAGVGDTLPVAGHYAQLEVTLLGSGSVAVEPEWFTGNSRRAVGVRLRIANVGEDVYEDWLPNCVTLIDDRGRTHAMPRAPLRPEGGKELYRGGEPLPGDLWAVTVRPGDAVTGWVYFPLAAAREPRALRFTAESGFGPETVEWSLR
jgi:hypothetical protein